MDGTTGAILSYNELRLELYGWSQWLKDNIDTKFCRDRIKIIREKMLLIERSVGSYGDSYGGYLNR